MSEPLRVIWRGPVLPHESCWNLLARLAQSNYFPLTSLHHLLWPRGIHATTHRPFPSDLWGEQGVHLLEHIAELIDLPKERFQQAFLIDCVREYEIQLLVYPNFRYCTECAQQGYHSALYQLLLIQRCPIHDVPLETVCPECWMEIGYGLDRGNEGIGSCSKCGYRYWLGERAGTLAPNLTTSMDELRHLLVQRKQVLFESMLYECTEPAAEKLHALPSWKKLMLQKIYAYRCLEKSGKVEEKQRFSVADIARAKFDLSEKDFVESVKSCVHDFHQTYLQLEETIGIHHRDCLNSDLANPFMPCVPSHPYCSAVKAFADWERWYLSDPHWRTLVLRNNGRWLRSLGPYEALQLSGTFLTQSLHHEHPGLSSSVFRQELLADYYGRLLGRIDAYKKNAVEVDYGEPRFYWYLPHWLVTYCPEDFSMCRLLVPDEVSMADLELLIAGCPCELRK